MDTNKLTMMINLFEDYLRSIGSDPEIIFDPNYVNQTRDLAQRLQNANVQLGGWG